MECRSRLLSGLVLLVWLEIALEAIQVKPLIKPPETARSDVRSRFATMMFWGEQVNTTLLVVNNEREQAHCRKMILAIR